MITEEKQFALWGTFEELGSDAAHEAMMEIATQHRITIETAWAEFESWQTEGMAH